MKLTQWKVGTYDETLVSELVSVLRIPSLTAKLLVARGITNEKDIESFTKKDLSSLYDPFLLKDMEKAVFRIETAIEKNEKVCIYGDYDADGVTSTYIMVHYLRSRGVDCTYYIPDRFEDGYGVSKTAIDGIKESGVSLIITVDTGITAVDEIEYANGLGIDVVVTDHHKCGEVLPPALAIVNPNREDCTYPFCSLAGVGVAFKLVSALAKGERAVLEKYLPYVCIGTVADVMPITEENRIIVSCGLQRISDRKEPGITALLDAAGSRKNEPITSGGVGFLIGPRMNAAGRMGNAELALKLLFAEGKEAEKLAEELNEKNRERQACESMIMKEALAVLSEHPEYKEGNAIVISGEKWHHGVLGIVASRICNMFEKPTILISVEEDECRGSGRSVAGVSLHRALGACSELLVKFGGHDLAAGISILPENIETFRGKLNLELSAEMGSFVPVLNIDFEVGPEELTREQVRSLDVMEPYGKLNEEPVMRINKCKVSKIIPIGNGSHTKLVIEHGGTFQCVYFGKTSDSLPFSEGDYADFAFTPKINTMYGENVQLHIKDARPCESVLKELEEAEKLLSGERVDNLEVSYEELGLIWRLISKDAFPKSVPLTSILRHATLLNRAIDIKKLVLALVIFSEVNLLSFDYEGYRVQIRIAEHNNKVDLNDSETYRIYKSCGSK